MRMINESVIALGSHLLRMACKDLKIQNSPHRAVSHVYGVRSDNGTHMRCYKNWYLQCFKENLLGGYTVIPVVLVGIQSK